MKENDKILLVCVIKIHAGKVSEERATSLFKVKILPP
jgi:hypothetical protein